MSVSFIRQEVRDADPVWQKIRDITEGDNLESYLRDILKPSGVVDSTRTKQYKKNAIFYGVAGHTYRGLVGTIFSKAPSSELETTLEYVEENVDGLGNSIHQQSHGVAGDVVRYGRCGLWVDFAKTDGPLSLADQDRFFATINHYKPWQIINWRTERDGANMRLTMVVLKEWRQNSTGFEVKSEKIHRELALVTGEDGRVVYRVRTWVEGGEGGKKEWMVESETFPTNSQGQMLDYIPFTFVGSENNDEFIDAPPMHDIVRVNIGHYRNSADYEDAVFYAGQTQPWMSGVDEEYYNLMDQKDFYIGSRQLMPVPSGETFGFATPDPNPAVRQAMIDKIDQMIGLGARFIQESGAAKTASQARSDESSRNSVLSTIASNVTAAYKAALQWAADFQGGPGNSTFELADDFSGIAVTPQMFTAWVEGFLRGATPFSDYVAWMKRHGFFDADKSEDEIREELDDFASDLSPGGATNTQ